MNLSFSAFITQRSEITLAVNKDTNVTQFLSFMTQNLKNRF